jgi:site-specific recombinase XerD
LKSNAFLLIRATGMRIGECLSLPVDSLREFGPNGWAIHVPLGKLHSERWVPIDAEGCAIFRNILALRSSVASPASANSPPLLLLQKNAKPPSYTAMRDELIKAAREAGCSVQPAPHQLRHSYATAMLRAGVSLPVLKELLGHRSIAMTMIYIEVTQMDTEREYFRARQRMAESHIVPKVEGALNSTLPTLAELLIRTEHLIEMRRRQLNDSLKKHKLTQLRRRVVNIASELKLLDTA